MKNVPGGEEEEGGNCSIFHETRLIVNLCSLAWKLMSSNVGIDSIKSQMNEVYGRRIKKPPVACCLIDLHSLYIAFYGRLNT